MEFKGTPAPWTANGKTVTKSNGEKIRMESRPGGACMSSMNRNQERYLADAKLIASAPKLLECLQEFVLMIESEEITIQNNFDNDGFENAGSRIYEQAKQAIKQALG